MSEGQDIMPNEAANFTTSHKAEKVKKVEDESEGSLEFRHITDKIAEKLELTDAKPITLTERVAATSMRLEIKKGLLKHKVVQEGTFQVSKLLAGENLPRFPENAVSPTGREGNSSWGVYSQYVLNGNENLYNLSPEEFEDHQARTRFNVLVPIEGNSNSISNDVVQEHVYKVFSDSEDAMPWVNGTQIEHSYKVAVKSADDVAVIDAREGWENIDPAAYKDKVVYIRSGSSGDSLSEEEQKNVKAILDNNKFIIREINDPTTGNVLEAVANHNWIDANALKRGLNQIAEPMGGYRNIKSDQELQQVLNQSAERFNTLHPLAKTRMRTVVLDSGTVQQINVLHENLYNAIPTYKRLAEIYDYDDKAQAPPPDALTIIPVQLQHSLTPGRLTQLLAQQAAGVDGNKVKGGVLLFRSNTEEELDHFETYGNLDTMKTLMETINDPQVDKRTARHAAEQLRRLTDFYHEDKSNITGKIGVALEHLGKPKTRLEMAYATVKSGAARGNSGQVMTSYAEIEGKYVVKRKTSESTSLSTDDKVDISGFAGSAHPTFMDSSFSIACETSYDNKVGNRIDRMVVSVKS